MRKTRRDSRPSSYQLFTDSEEKARLEARNGLLQFDEVLREIDHSIHGQGYRIRPSTIQAFQRIVIQDIYTCAGNYRTGNIDISNSNHQPPLPQEIPKLVEEMCDYVESHWGTASPIHLSAYCMWRVNWIHPFEGGNGRTSRAVSYLALCAKLGYTLPGTLTIPEQIVSDRQPYYKALDAADEAWTNGTTDVTAMEELLSAMLASQLVSVHEQAQGN